MANRKLIEISPMIRPRVLVVLCRPMAGSKMIAATEGYSNRPCDPRRWLVHHATAPRFKITRKQHRLIMSVGLVINAQSVRRIMIPERAYREEYIQFG